MKVCDAGKKDSHNFQPPSFDMSPPTGTNRRLSDLEHSSAVSMLVAMWEEHKWFPPNFIRRVSERFGVAEYTIWRLWKRAESASNSGVVNLS